MIDTEPNSTDKITRRKLLASTLGAWVFLSATDTAVPLDLQSTSGIAKESKSRGNISHRIVNIYNFIRNSDSRLADSENILFDATEHQIDLLKENGLPATFALQYDALINPRYQQLLKSKLTDINEIGAWWEIPQPLVEKAGLKWRGRWPWDWQANIGFSPGYEPDERKKLVDVYMADFKSIFGKYPATAGSWYIDEVTLAYMAEKYGIVASCNCKDQIGTDGYTLWGGYWNQAYYPSRLNAYMPAQTRKAQIDIPVFRMLGSDPIYQYTEGVGGATQGVITLEVIYSPGGKSPEWVRWFLGEMINEPCLAFAYTQAGQENSFGWNSMSEGLQFQIPYLAQLAKSGGIKVETLEQSGKWFRNQFRVTPATSVVALKDWQNRGRKTVWYESRYYRINLFWDENAFSIRDIHLFNENLESPVHDQALTATRLECLTLPVMDGNLWSASDATDRMAGIRLVEMESEGKTQPLNVTGEPLVTEPDEKQMLIRFPVGTDGEFEILCSEERVTFAMHKDAGSPTPWAMDMSWNASRHTGITQVQPNAIHYSNSGGNYALKLASGASSQRTPEEPSILLSPAHGRIVMEMKCKLSKEG